MFEKSKTQESASTLDRFVPDNHMKSAKHVDWCALAERRSLSNHQSKTFPLRDLDNGQNWKSHFSSVPSFIQLLYSIIRNLHCLRYLWRIFPLQQRKRACQRVLQGTTNASRELYVPSNNTIFLRLVSPLNPHSWTESWMYRGKPLSVPKQQETVAPGANPDLTCEQSIWNTFLNICHAPLRKRHPRNDCLSKAPNSFLLGFQREEGKIPKTRSARSRQDAKTVLHAPQPLAILRTASLEDVSPELRWHN